MKPESKPNQAIVDLLDGRVLGFSGTKTDTFMCMDTYINFHEWVVKKFLGGDKHMSWLLKDVNKSNYFKDKGGKGNHRGRNNRVKKATYTLGDLGVLQELKKKFDDN